MKTLLAALCAAAVLLPAAASANPFASEARTIRTDDLDLSKLADQRRLENRLSEAATDVCGRGMDLIHNALKDQARQCHDEVVAENRARVGQLVARATGAHGLAMK